MGELSRIVARSGRKGVSMEEKRKPNEIVGNRGKIHIAEGVISSIAGLAVAEVRGLGKARESLADQVARVFSRGKGVEMKLEEDAVKFTLRVSLQYGQPIPTTAQKIQETVARRVKEMAGLQVSGVDVYIQEIQFPEEVEQARFTEDELQSRIMEIIRAHPEGIKLADIGQVLGIDWRLLTSTAKRIVSEGKARKEGKEYFPIG